MKHKKGFITFFLRGHNSHRKRKNTMVSLIYDDPEEKDSLMKIGRCSCASAFELISQTIMGDSYNLVEKIDAEMKTFPWNYPDQYVLSEFIPSPCNFTGYVQFPNLH